LFYFLCVVVVVIIVLLFGLFYGSVFTTSKDVYNKLRTSCRSEEEQQQEKENGDEHRRHLALQLTTATYEAVHDWQRCFQIACEQ